MNADALRAEYQKEEENFRRISHKRVASCTREELRSGLQSIDRMMQLAQQLRATEEKH